MTETLKVIKPFFICEKDDEFKKTEDNMYKCSCDASYSNDDCNSDYNYSSTYSQSYEISEDYAKALIKDGYLAEVSPKAKHINIFDEIALLKNTYIKQYDNLDEKYKNEPECLKLENKTVLSNMIKLLSHLESLKK